jgi:uncharacterized membrane protein
MTMRMRGQGAVVILLAIHALLVIAATVATRESGRVPDDFFYAKYSRSVLDGQVPYRDFNFEYPPVALVPMLIPRLFMGHRQDEWPLYHFHFGAESLFWDLVIAVLLLRLAALLRWSRRRSVLAFGFYTAFVCAAAPVLPWRFDIFAALLTTLSLYGLCAGRPLWAGVWLALAMAAKIYPVVCVPIILLYYHARGERQALMEFLRGAAVTLLLVGLPFYLAAPEDWLSYLRFNVERSMQIETVSGGALALASQLRGSPVHVQHDYGAYHLYGGPVRLILALLPWVFLCLYALLSAGCVKFFRRQQAREGTVAPESLIFGLAAALLAFILCNKVLSPQYLIWLMPLAALLERRCALTFLAACVLTFILYPYRYEELLRFQAPEVLALNLRNGLLIAIFAGMIRKTARPARP